MSPQRVPITLDPASMLAPSPAKSPLDYDFDVIDVLWIDAALAELGYSKTDTPRLEDRIGALTADAALGLAFAGANPDDVYLVFVTKYPCHWGGYARPDLGFATLCLPKLDKQGWQGKLDLVFAHETGHIFGGLDEYVSRELTCQPALLAGPFETLNSNCELNNPRSVKCLMKDSDLQLCDQTPLHWGWSDDDHDGVMDLAAPPTIDAFSVYDPVNQIWIPAGRAAEPGWTVTITGRKMCGMPASSSSGASQAREFGAPPSTRSRLPCRAASPES